MRDRRVVHPLVPAAAEQLAWDHADYHTGAVSPDWSATERLLWDAMWDTHHKIETSKKYAKILKKARHAGGKRYEQDVKRRLGIVSEEQAIAADWRAYQRWVEH